MTVHVLDALNQPIVFLLLLVGTGGFLIAGELQTIARGFRRTAGRGGATARATSSGSPALGRRYRLTLLVLAGLLLMSAFGTTSASFSLRLSGGARFDVVLPTKTPAPTHTPTLTPAATNTPTLTPAPTAAPAPTDTPAPTDSPAPTDTAVS